MNAVPIDHPLDCLKTAFCTTSEIGLNGKVVSQAQPSHGAAKIKPTGICPRQPDK